MRHGFEYFAHFIWSTSFNFFNWQGNITLLLRLQNLQER